ncbi:MAG: LamG domain-containing protein [Bacteriovoracaceae bacterium]|jgi:hypothetical protein|nr:LamG domain-containing protein [Bacteriovoracaceae bacterium]
MTFSKLVLLLLIIGCNGSTNIDQNYLLSQDSNGLVTASQIVITANNFLTQNDTYQIDLTFNSDISFSGSATIDLDIGGVTRSANFTVQPTSNSMRFIYTITNADNDYDGITISPMKINITTGQITSDNGTVSKSFSTLSYPLKFASYDTVYYLNPKRADGSTNYSSGCTDTNYVNLARPSINAILTNFSSCATYGWQGSGTDANPYHVNFAGGEIINMGYDASINSTFDIGQTWSIALWYKNTGGTPAAWRWIFMKPFTSHVSPYYQVDIIQNNTNKIFGRIWRSDAFATYMSAGSPTAIDTNWNFITLVKESLVLKLYINGTLVATDTTPSGTHSNYTRPMALAGNINVGTATYNVQGMIGSTFIIQNDLNGTQVTNLCALSNDYNSSICN